MEAPLPVRPETQRPVRCVRHVRFCKEAECRSGNKPGAGNKRSAGKLLVSSVVLTLSLSSLPPPASGQKQPSSPHLAPAPAAQRPPAPVERRTPAPAPPAASASVEPSNLRPIQRNLAPNVHTGRGIPLAEWMTQHSQLNPTDQQHALEREPGFRDLPQPTQERMRQRLSQLNNMPPVQRQRLLARNEAMEHLTPDQRFQVRGAMQQLGSLPQDQRRLVARTFRELRDLPADQRAGALNSERYRSLFTDTQRSTLDNLLRIEPMLPPPDRTPH